MKKTMFNSAILVAIVSLTFTPFASAHDMGSDDNPNIDYVDDQVSDNHTAIIEELNEEDDLMGIIYQGIGADEPTMAMGDGANSVDTATQSSTQVIDGPGRGSMSATRGSAR